jgi:hypothetical protein
MFGLLDYLKIGGGAALGAFIAFGPSYLYGKHEGRQQAAVAALEQSVKVLQARNKIDDEISASDAARLCTDFGLSNDEAAECVRRLEEANAKP